MAGLDQRPQRDRPKTVLTLAQTVHGQMTGKGPVPDGSVAGMKGDRLTLMDLVVLDRPQGCLRLGESLLHTRIESVVAIGKHHRNVCWAQDGGTSNPLRTHTGAYQGPARGAC